MLWRQGNSADVIRRLFSFKFRRNLSVASVLHIDEKTVGERNGLLAWLKDIFNKSAENKSHKADATIIDRAATITTFNRPEIAAPMRLADISDKADVVNQKLANFCAARSTTKFEYRNIRAEKRDAENGERAYTIQQSAIYTAPQSNRFAAGKTRIDPDDSSWRDPGKMYRSERNGGAIKFVAKDDLDVASYYRCYTNPRPCYRLPPQRIKQPLLPGLRVPNRYIGVPTRPIVGFASRNIKSIREPNAPEKRERKDEKDRKERKKPVIRTDGESVSVDSSENRAEMVADDNPRSNPDAAFRYEWGVKLAEEQPAAEAANDNDKFAEKGQQYVTKLLWGVNLKQPKPDIAPPATASSEGGAGEPRNASTIFDTTTGDDVVPASNSANKSDTSSLKDIAEYLSTPSSQTDSSDNFLAAQQDSGDANMSSDELRKILRTFPNKLKESIIVDSEYNIPEGAARNAEITAWRNLAMTLDSEVKENYSDNAENLEMMSISPEAPQPKLDMRTPTDDDLKDKRVEPSDSSHVSPKSIEIKRVGSPRRSDDYSVSKKLYTTSTQIRCIHRHVNSINQQCIGSLSSDFALVDRTMQTKYSRYASAFSTNPEDFMLKKEIDEASRNKQQMDSKSQDGGKSNDPDSSNTLDTNGPILSVESRTFSSSDQEQADANHANALDVIADKEMEISMSQLQSIGRKKIAHLSDSITSFEFTQKNKSRYKDKDIQDEVERCEEPYVNYAVKGANFDNHSTNNNSVKSAKRYLSNNNATYDSNVVDDDPSKEYISDDDYVRLPGDPYPYSRENLDKWHVPRARNLVYPWKRETSRSSNSPTVVRSTLRNSNDAYVNAAGEPRDSHAGDGVMETLGSGGDGGARKRTGQASGFHVSSQDQRVVSDCLRGDSADALGLRQWTEAFSLLDVGEKMNEAARSGDNAPFRVHYE